MLLLSYSPSIGSQLRRGFFSSSLSRLSKLSILVLLVICLHIFNLVSTKLNTVSVRIWPLHLRSLVPKNKQAIVPFLWLGLIFGMGCRAVSVLSIIWTGTVDHMDRFKNKLKSHLFSWFFQALWAHCKRHYINHIIIIICVKLQCIVQYVFDNILYVYMWIFRITWSFRWLVAH